MKITLFSFNDEDIYRQASVKRLFSSTFSNRLRVIFHENFGFRCLLSLLKLHLIKFVIFPLEDKDEFCSWLIYAFKATIP